MFGKFLRVKIQSLGIHEWNKDSISTTQRGYKMSYFRENEEKFEAYKLPIDQHDFSENMVIVFSDLRATLQNYGVNKYENTHL